ncbi:GMC family oxidoreductase [Litoreibacter roseus]|uniref:Choline dehydrogenase n=1 Tax=Litoreibacter roseus TaxID=2601869 RepID=A0A6N6JDZ8_9RHOB|nr:choline dehydrogenase [Litoreibacter roseus]GFE64197.1 choline dehydrogenase [Litoreibacter roseus]
MEFDFVIVGAGSAGCVLANRLSANGKHSVAVLEAGGKDTYPWIHIPVGYFKTMGNPKTDWSYETAPDPGLNGRSIKWPRGKVLGGSSSINGLLYVRGQAQDYDGWRQLGNTGWSWEDILPLFKRSESYDAGEDEVRGRNGPLSVSDSTVTRTIVDEWLEAAVNAGYRANPDYNGAVQEGVGLFQLTTRNGRRCSAAVAYLNPAKSRQNLTVLTHCPVKKLTIEGKRVTGLIAQYEGKQVTITARREVILSAGALASPQILMVSGIGEADALQPHGIEVRHELKGVGRNLQDHLQARPVFKCTRSTINTEVSNLFKQALIGLQYITTRGGPMAMAASLGTGFLKTREDLAVPDIQFHIQPFSTDKMGTEPHTFDAFTASVLQLRPESAGHLELTSSDMRDYPIIHPNYLSTKTDCDTLVEGIRIARRIARHEPVADAITEEYQPGAQIANDDYDGLLNWARETSTTIYHPTGTCKMGVDPMAVVDPRLKVHGIDGLRVADASIMPIIVSGNTNAPSIMIGEKASDLILEDAEQASQTRQREVEAV